MFPRTDTSDFVGSVRCTAPEGGRFTGVAVELDAANRIFTTLPVVPVDSMDAQDQEGVLDFAHFANGAAIVSDLVLINAGTAPTRPALYFYDQAGAPIAAESVVDVLGDLVVREDGAFKRSDGVGIPGRTHDFDPRPGRGGERIGKSGLGQPHWWVYPL